MCIELDKDDLLEEWGQYGPEHSFKDWLCSELVKARAENIRLKEHDDKASRQRQVFFDRMREAEAENSRLLDIIRQIQWSGTGDVLSSNHPMCPMCPLCDQVPESGHSPDCQIGAVLE